MNYGSGTQLMITVREILALIRNEGLEVVLSSFADNIYTYISNSKELIFYLFKSYQIPFIAHYRKEVYRHSLQVDDLWRIYQWDVKVNLMHLYLTHLITASVEDNF